MRSSSPRRCGRWRQEIPERGATSSRPAQSAWSRKPAVNAPPRARPQGAPARGTLVPFESPRNRARVSGGVQPFVVRDSIAVDRSGTHRVPGCAAGRRWCQGFSPRQRRPTGLSWAAAMPSRPAIPSTAREVVTQFVPKTRKPRCGAVLEALCRTRTGDPFLTMAAGRRTGLRSASKSACTRRESHARRHPARERTSCISGTHWVPGPGLSGRRRSRAARTTAR